MDLENLVNYKQQRQIIDFGDKGVCFYLLFLWGLLCYNFYTTKYVIYPRAILSQ